MMLCSLQLRALCPRNASKFMPLYIAQTLKHNSFFTCFLLSVTQKLRTMKMEAHHEANPTCAVSSYHGNTKSSRFSDEASYEKTSGVNTDKAASVCMARYAS